MAGLISELNEYLLIENVYLRQVDFVMVFKIQTSQAKLLENIRKTNDINLILGAEKSINSFYLEFYGNSQSMVASLNDTMEEILATEILIKILQDDPNDYWQINRSYTLAKNRINGLPKDEARQFFKGQAKRLFNMDKVHLGDTQKKIIEVRRNNIRELERVYEKMQYNALNKEES